MKSQVKTILIFLAIIGIACYFRLTGLNWDQGNHLHPDERFIVMTVEKIQWPDQLNPKFFAYGSLPLYLLKVVGMIGATFNPQFGSYEKIQLLGRVVSTIFDIGTMIMVFCLMRLLTKTDKTAYLAAFWYAISVLPIQLSHFYAVDTILTFFMTTTLYILIRYHKRSSLGFAILIGVSFGMAVATKVSAVMLAIPIGITILIGFRTHWKKRSFHTAIILITTLITFFICEPYAFLDFSTFSRQIMEQQAMTKDAFVFPYTLQYVGIIPYWYELKNIFLWGQGPILATISFFGILYSTYLALRKKNIPLLILISYFWVYTGTVGRFAIGFMRYMLPIYPILTVAAVLFFQLCMHTINRKYIIPFCLIITIYILVWTTAFMAIYSAPNTRTTASEWILKNIPTGTAIALEHWDDGLPLQGSSRYKIMELPLYDPDTNEKWIQINRTLSQTAYIIIASNRLYVPLMKMTNCEKLPLGKCYARTASYYDQLFSGTLGFEKVAEFSSYPTIPFLNITIDDISADESFTVYDHPKIMVFKKTGIFKPIPLEE